MNVHRRTCALVASVAIATAASPAASNRIILEDDIARYRVRYLADRSATMKQLLGVLERTPDVLIRVRAVFGLRHWSPHIAHSVLGLEDDVVHAVVSFDPGHARITDQLEMVAHELAHVVEVACLPRAEIVKGLEPLLLSRGFAVRRPGSRHAGIETHFAVEVGREVLVEAMKQSKESGSLGTIARRHRLGGPCAAQVSTSATAESRVPDE